MAADLAPAPRTGLSAQLCGDAHLSNFGVFASPERRLIFDLNDFDETLPGPFEWDVKRLAASFAVAGARRGFDGKQRGARSTWPSVRSYREAMARVRGMRDARPLVRARSTSTRSLQPCAPQAKAKAAEAGRAEPWRRRGPRTASQAFAKLTEIVDGEPRIVSDPPLIVPLEELLRPR